MSRLRTFLPVFGALAFALLTFWAAPARADRPAEGDAKQDAWDVGTADLGPTRSATWTLDEGTWMSVDVSPDGATLVFDLLGDIYAMGTEGGKAEPLRTGRPWEIQPRFSPDGEWISFTSDAGGGDNIWVMRKDGSDARQVTEEDFRLLNNAVWMPDGESLIARKHFTSRRSLGAGEMWLYDVAHGGGGVQITERPNDQKDVGEPEISPDGRFLYYSIDATPGSTFEYNKDPNGTIYEIRRVDLLTGETVTVVDEAGSGMRPQISPDGRHLAYVHRVRTDTWLVVRDLDTGEDRPLTNDLYRDQQETWAIFGVYPGFSWTPDGQSIVIWGKGRLQRVDVASGAVTVIPFEVEAKHTVTEALRFHPEIGGETFPVEVVRWPRVSPDGRSVVFQAIGRLWIRDRDGGTPRPLTGDEEVFEFHPRWSADGKRIVFTTWSDTEGGRVVTVNANGGGRRAVVEVPGHYAEPAFSADGKWIVYRRGGGDRYRGRLWATDPGVYVVDARGGEPRRVTEDGTMPRFADDDRRILVLRGGDQRSLVSLDLLGGDPRVLATSERAVEMVPSPDGRYLAFEELWEVYVCPLPRTGGPIAVGPEMTSLPVRKVSTIAGEFLDWAAGSAELRFSLGSQLFEVAVAPRFEGSEPEGEEIEPTVVELGWNRAADVPPTDLAFVNATILTMDDDDTVIDGGTVRVRGNRIVAVGPDVDTAGATIVDLGGRVLMPGFVDTHAHTGSSNLDTHAQQNWAFLANLAFGVTTTHDPSNTTRMIFGSRELVDAGRVLGPRVFSTGTILYGAEGDFKAVTESLEDAERHLRRLKAYGAFSVKSYNQPRRNQRQWIVAKARELEMMVVPEGGSTFHHNMTHFVDGHTTLEHAIPLAPLYDDALNLMLLSGTAYTPTLIVGYGGLWGENHWYQKTNVWENERLLHFVPRSVVDPRARRRVMVPDDEFFHIDLARTAAEFVERGGTATIGAHGQMQGIGVHWEMWMYEQGGLSPMQVLRVATRMGAHAIGLDHAIGSVEAGKLADLIVLARDPREDLRRSEEVDLVMANGRLYDAHTLDQLQPEARDLPPGPPTETVFDLGVLCGCGAH